MSEAQENFLALLRGQFSGQLLDSRINTGQVVIDVRPGDLLAVCRKLHDDEQFAFTMLMDVCGVDFLSYGEADWETEDTTSTGFSRGVSKGVYDEDSIQFPGRYAVVYQLLSLQHNRRLRVRCFINGEPPQVSSVVDIWASANWFEREAFDLFGILFDGHPDLRRILTDYGFIGHPFRKDFPLSGNVEVIYDQAKKRVVYQPVSIEPRTLVPRVIRHDNRYSHPDSGSQPADK